MASQINCSTTVQNIADMVGKINELKTLIIQKNDEINNIKHDVSCKIQAQVEKTKFEITELTMKCLRNGSGLDESYESEKNELLQKGINYLAELQQKSLSDIAKIEYDLLEYTKIWNIK
jgi:hypothetical protein